MTNPSAVQLASCIAIGCMLLGCVSTTPEPSGAPGTSEILYPDGELAAVGAVRGETQVGRWRFYHGSGSLLASGEFSRAGKLTGPWVVLHPDGTVSKDVTLVCRNNRLKSMSTGQVFFEDAFPTGLPDQLRPIMPFDRGLWMGTGYYESGVMTRVLSEDETSAQCRLHEITTGKK